MSNWFHGPIESNACSHIYHRPQALVKFLEQRGNNDLFFKESISQPFYVPICAAEYK